MALLNIANTYDEIKTKIGLDPALTGDYVKLFFSKDGHIITHGRDFLATFNATTRGLVPEGSGNDVKKILHGNATWAAIATSDLPIGPVSNNNTTTIPTTLYVKLYVDSSFATNDAMRYKGTITKTADGFTHNTTGTETAGFPTKCEVGDTYRVTVSGIYYTDANGTNGKKCETGDLLICIKDGEGSGLNTAEYWTSIQTNINGQVLHNVNGTPIFVYSNSNTTFTIFAPTTEGIRNLVLLSSGDDAPVWADQSALNVGSANKVKNALSAGAGLAFDAANVKFDGSAARTIKLVPATASTIGGVIVDKDSTNKTISVNTSTGSIYLTKLNVVNALGFTPGDSADAKTYSIILADTASATAAKNSANPFINLILTVGSTPTVTGSILILGSGNVTVAGTTAIAIGLNAATDSNYGGVKIGYTTAGRNYAVLLDGNGKAFVNVPLPGLATATADGLVPKFDDLGSGMIDPNSWVLAKLSNGTYDWFKLPANAFTNTWRLITVGGVSIGSKTLNFVPSGDVYLKVDSNNDGIEDISFGLSWYNINTTDYETA